MKPYFVKFLPTEGELKEGTILRSKRGYISKPLNELQAKKFQEHREKHTIVKPYLCSRDIKVGDTVKLLHGSNNDYDIKFEDELNSAEWYKVIGEISPNAIWVTEDMEFEEDQVKQITESYEWEREWVSKEHRGENKEEFITRFQKFFDKSLSRTHELFTFNGFYTDENNCDYVTIKVVKKEYKIKCPTCKTFH